MEDLKVYKVFLKEYKQSYASYCLLKALSLHKATFDYIIETQLKYAQNSLNSLEKADLIRIVNDEYIPTVKGKAVFKSNKQVDEVIAYFNELKLKKLKIKHTSKCKAQRSAILNRIKEYGLDKVKGVIDVKFDLWATSPNNSHLCTSMKTMVVESTFEDYVSKIELFKKKVINQTSKMEL